MCHEHGHDEHGRHEHGCHHGHEQPGRHGRRGLRGGFGRHGFPTREEWLERLEAHRERLEQDLANVRDLIDRLGRDEPRHADA